MTLPDLEIRIQQLLDDELTAEEFAELETELMENPEAMDLYLSYSGLQSDLQHHSAYQETAEKVSVVPVEELLAQQRRRSIQISLVSAAAIVMLIAVVMWITNVSPTLDTLATVRVTPGSDFTLTHNTDEETPNGNVMVENSRIILRHGVVEIKLPHDVRAIVEAPAEMVLRDDRTLELNHGRAYFKISSKEGEGFTVVTPHQRIVDLGTAFGIDSQNGSKEIELHVLEGEVRVDSKEGTNEEIIKANRAVMLAGTRVLREIDNPSISFLRNLPPKIDILLDENFETGLTANRDYVIQMDPTVIRDLAGNRFKGIDDDTTWKFTTGSAASTVQNFSFEQNAASSGAAVAHWPEVTGTKKLFNTYKKDKKLTPTDGNSFLMIQGDKDQARVLAQDVGNMITAGTTYRLTVDVGSTKNTASARGFIRLFGSDAGYQSALAETIITPPAGKWLRDQTVTFTATAASATSQTLGIALGSTEGRVIFDNVRLMPIRPIRHINAHATSISQPATATGRDTTPPIITRLHPANNAAGVSPAGPLTVTFDEPVKLGTGRVFLRSINNWSDRKLFVGDPRISVDGRVLTITPPAELKDGSTQMGLISGWDTNGWVGIFNPNGKGKRYLHDDFNDQSKAQGEIDAMRGPVMATLGTDTSIAKSSISRTIGSIAPNRHYSVSAAIGVRAETAKIAAFPGYTIRLTSGDTTLAHISSNTPPGPPNSVSTVGFSWHSSHLPKGINLGDPLTLTISTNQTSPPGYLDLDSIRVSVLGKTGR